MPIVFVLFKRGARNVKNHLSTGFKCRAGTELRQSEARSTEIWLQRATIFIQLQLIDWAGWAEYPIKKRGGGAFIFLSRSYELLLKFKSWNATEINRKYSGSRWAAASLTSA